MPTTTEQVDQIFRREHARVVASLVRRFGDIGIAEDAASEALLVALQRWPTQGLPPNPGGWLTTTAGNRALDHLRRESARDAKEAEATTMNIQDPPEPVGAVQDDRLRLIFICCHPALAPEARIALTLRLLCGLTVPEIAAAFFVPETTMAQRLTRAKRKIKAAHIPFRVPHAGDLPDRLAAVLAVVYLVFNEGYLSSGAAEPVREDLCTEAIRLGRLVTELLPEEPEAAGLLALMLLTDARRPARVSDGRLVTLPEQDRSLWDAGRIREGHEIVRRLLRLNRPGQYQLLAAINAVHTDATTSEDTDWSQILALYDRLLQQAPSPLVRLNRAVAVAELDGPQVALTEVDSLPLDGYHAWHATRADLLRRLDRRDEAASAYAAAIASTSNEAERAFLQGRLSDL